MDAFGELFNAFENMVNSNSSLFNNMSTIKSIIEKAQINETALNESLSETGFYDVISSNFSKNIEEMIKDLASISKNKSETNKNSIISKNNITKKNTNYTNNIINQTKPLLTKPINKIDTNYIFYLKIIIPIIIVFLLIIIICYCIKKRIKSKMKTNNDNISQNNQLNNSGDSGVKQHYNRILNTSGNANNIETPNNLSEIKVENIKKEIDEIVNTPGSSSGRRKRGKKIPDKNNNSGLDEKQDQMQNEIKEQIKQYVIDEHNNI